MFNKINNLYSILKNCNYTLESETEEVIKISLFKDLFQSNEIFLDTIISIIELNPSEITIESTITQPSLSNKKSSFTFPNYIIEHLNHAERLATKNINYRLVIPKNSILHCNEDTNYIWFLKEAFYKKLLLNPFNNIDTISKIHTIYKPNIIILLQDSNTYIKNNSTLIIDINNLSKIDDFNAIDSNLILKKDLRRSCCNIEINISNIVPDLFIFDYSNSIYSLDESLKIIYNNLFVLFFIIYLSNNSSLNGTIVSSKISSNKSIVIDYNIDDLNKNHFNYDKLIQLYYLCYNSINIQNIYLVRNMLCIYLCDDCSHTMLDLFYLKANQVLDSSNENLNILTIGNVESYFSIRYNLYDFLDKSTEYIQSQISELTSKMNKTLLSTIATLVGVSYVYLKNENITILKLSLLIYTAFLIIDCIYSFTTQFLSYLTYIKRHNNKLDYFKPVLGNEQYDKITNKDSITKKVKIRFHIYFWVSLIIYIAMIALGILSFMFTTKIIEIIKLYIK